MDGKGLKREIGMVDRFAEWKGDRNTEGLGIRASMMIADKGHP